MLNLSLGFLDDEIVEIPGGVLRSGASFVIDTDNDLPMTPEYNGSIGLQYTHNMDAAGRLVFRADYSFKDDYYTRIENVSETLEDNYNVVNASIRWVSANERWEVGVWARNLTDELYYKARRIFETLGAKDSAALR